jgi:thymidylate synthase
VTVFEPIVNEKDQENRIIVREAPECPHVVVAARWTPVERVAKAHYYAAAVCPLRSILGVNLMIRSLAKNPQVRVVVLAGRDATPGEVTTEALLDTWSGSRRHVDEDIPDEVFRAVIENVRLVETYGDGTFVDPFDPFESLPERPGGRHVLPPPLPKAGAPAPHGDPGERVAADTLREVWPVALARVMRFGRVVPTQYGNTRELTNLVTVIRDPAASVPHLPEWMGLSVEAVEGEHRGITQSSDNVDVAYTYGDRFRGTVPEAHERDGVRRRIVRKDQIQAISALLDEKPDSRAAVHVTWDVDQDAGVESNRPCLLSLQFRIIPGPPVDPACPSGKCADLPSCICTKRVFPGTLLTSVVFRSHDMFGAWHKNLAAVCSWAVAEAEARGLDAGEVTCVSTSAHVYERSWNAALEIARRHPPKLLDWDQRSIWRVDVVEREPASVAKGESFHVTSHLDNWCDFTVLDVDHDADRVEIRVHGEDVDSGRTIQIDKTDVRTRDEWLDLVGRSVIRAQCMTPDNSKVVEVFHGVKASEMQARIVRSGLVTSTGNAMWLGGEIVAAEKELSALEYVRKAKKMDAMVDAAIRTADDQGFLMPSHVGTPQAEELVRRGFATMVPVPDPTHASYARGIPHGGVVEGTSVPRLTHAGFFHRSFLLAVEANR